MKRLIAFGAPNIFQLSKVFRDAEQGHQHRSEFTMLEWYRPYATLEDIAADCEGLLSALVPKGHLSYQDADIDLSPPFPRRPFYELLRDRGGVREPERLTHDEALEAFVEHVERTLGHAHPEFVVDYPASMASLARTKRGAPHLAERLELYISGIELANGFDELTDAEEQRRRCAEDNAQRKALDLPSIPMDEDFLDALTQGMPPSAGIALGVDRLVMLLTDSAHIDDVLTF
jgi:lysyl-tRNA synthetase class 2